MSNYQNIARAKAIEKQNIKSLNEKITNAVKEWSKEMVDKGLSVDVGWDWSEDTKLD